MDDDSDYEEEILVYADFKNYLQPIEFADEKAIMKLIGIETKNPIAEINGQIFKGTYEDSMGTHIFFGKDEKAPQSDPLFDLAADEKYKFVTKTNKILSFERIFIENNSEEAEQSEDMTNDPSLSIHLLTGTSDSSLDSKNIFKTNISYEDALKLIPTKMSSENST